MHEVERYCLAVLRFVMVRCRSGASLSPPSPMVQRIEHIPPLNERERRQQALTTPSACRHLWGGMQYQLEHHLFPTMPRYKYRDLVPLVKKFAEDNSLEYKSTGSWAIMKDNIDQVRYLMGYFLGVSAYLPRSYRCSCLVYEQHQLFQKLVVF